MVVFPFAKINLGLNVVRVRPDGYRDIQTVMFPIPLHDALEAVVGRSVPDGECVMTYSGTLIPGKGDDLCLRAVRALASIKTLPGLRLHLHKAIPIGAGLGGGSSDATHTLLLLNRLLRLGLGEDELHRLAEALGSDTPFFLHRGAMLAEGRGERLSRCDVDLTGKWLVLVDPGIHVSTADAYRLTKPTGAMVDLPMLLSGAIHTWQGQVLNTMEDAVFALHPELAATKEALLEMGAAYASMSGSGSAVFGLFLAEPSAERTAHLPRHRIMRL